ncbi:MFS transporter [Chryseobacterium proteolyticum]|uniref:MFS transporter n=1 Tax=Chryseobacterium proteolyticum TaxID=118127 RepID=UPI003983ADB3
MKAKRIIPHLSFWQIWNMNVGFFGIQYSFGLQQTAVNPIYSFLGAHAEQLPILNLAGPITGLLIQPLIGAISDKTWSPKWGRRKPFFLLGALFCSIALFLFPFSSTIWMAAGLLWILDAANNTAMEPYRAFIGDKLPEDQQTFGFQMQSLFVGAGITLANLSLFVFQKYLAGNSTNGGIPVWVYYSFFLGSFCSIASVAWSVYKTPEIPPTEDELKEIKKSQRKQHVFYSFYRNNHCHQRNAKSSLATGPGVPFPVVCPFCVLAVYHAHAEMVTVRSFRS